MDDVADFNKRIVKAVDSLLQEAGYSEGSSVRNLLSLLNFDENISISSRILPFRRSSAASLDWIKAHHRECQMYYTEREYEELIGLSQRLESDLRATIARRDEYMSKYLDLGGQVE